MNDIISPSSGLEDYLKCIKNEFSATADLHAHIYSRHPTQVFQSFLSFFQLTNIPHLNLLHQISCYFVSSRCQDEFIMHLGCFKMVHSPRMTFGNEIKSGRCIYK